MSGINQIKIKSLEQTRAFYIWELKRSESLTEKQRESYILALGSIEKIIKEKEESGEKEKDKYFSKRLLKFRRSGLSSPGFFRIADPALRS